MVSATQDSLIKLSTDPETEGFDFQAGQIWIYPTNYPLRDYQYNIIQQALLKNTLVSLPTGLGKTFIAAVVMYNFYRWYPLGKIVFMAPTRPLVKQQVDACYDIMGIPKDVTAEITGTKASNTRNEIWNEKRVFFVTPQVLQNDLDTMQDLGPKIKCIVFDEAHKARGNYAYCEVIRKLQTSNKYFRVLALSATPGSNVPDVVEVANNLLISRIESRTEESPDVQPYVFQRNLETVVVPLGSKIQEVKENYLRVIEFYTRVLIKYKVIQGNFSTLTKGRIFMIMKNFQQKSKGTGNYGEIMKSLNICVTLYHALELLVRHGLRGFLSFFQENIDRPLFRGNQNLIKIIEEVREFLGPPPKIETLPDGTYAPIPENTKFGHPKFYKLQDILVKHFTEATDSTRVIVFFEYRESAKEAYALLLQRRPLIKPRFFLGQGAEMTQRDQINIIKAFREGQCNTLLSTCIGEEGLDIGEVDLIICFDISNTSPIRMIQRMGRTGRKKDGNIYILVTEGKEQETLKNCLIQKQNLQNYVFNSKELSNSLQKESPRMVPNNMVPRCEKIFITVKKPAITKNSTIKDLFRTLSANSEPIFPDDLDMREIEERLPKSELIWNKGNPLTNRDNPNEIYQKHLEKQRNFQPNYKIKPSKTTQMFVGLMQFADAKRYNIPMTQTVGFTQFTQEKTLKQGDIRNMFLKLKTKEEQIEQKVMSTQSSTTKTPEILDIITDEVFNEIRTFLLIQQTSEKTCRFCPENFDCRQFEFSKFDVNLQNWTEPDLPQINKITDTDLDLFLESLCLKTSVDLGDFGDDFFEEVVIEDEESEKLEKVGESFFNVDLSVVEECKPEESFAFVPPKNMENLLNRFSRFKSEEDVKTEISDEEVLSFFKLSSIEEIFESVEIEDEDFLDNTIIYSPASPVLNKRFTKKCTSPVLSQCNSQGSNSPVLSFKGLKAKKNLNISISMKETPKKPNFSRLNERVNSLSSPSRFILDDSKLSSTPIIEKTKPKLVEEIEDLTNIEDFNLTKGALTQFESKKQEQSLNFDDIDDICDLSVFGISSDKTNLTKQPSIDSKIAQNLEIDDLCDLSVFGLSENKEDSNVKSPVLSLASQRNFNKTIKPSLDLKKSQSQYSITQMLSLVSKSETPKKDKPSSNSQKENINIEEDLKDLDEFDFSFNVKKTPKLSLKKRVSPPKSTGKNERTQLSSIALNFDDTFVISSDDEFEPTQKNPVFAKPKETKLFRKSSEDDFEQTQKTPVFAKPKETKLFRESVKEKTPKKKPKKKGSDFFCVEAALSDDEDVFVSEDEEDNSEDDCFEMSFVDDNTEDIIHNTQIHANYLQSIRSPVRPGQFKIPARPRHNITNVFSQIENQEDNTYLHDSFCVETEDIDVPQNDLSELEILELKLKKMKKNKKRKSSDEKTGKFKRRRIIHHSSDDSD